MASNTHSANADRGGQISGRSSEPVDTEYVM